MFQEKSHPTATYHTAALNRTGVNGESEIIDEQRFPISSPNNPVTGANPEQFLGLALATCLNATLESIEKMNELPHTSEVRVDVYQAPDVHNDLMFLVDATILIPLTDAVNGRKAKAMLELAERRCPVAKLVGDKENVTFQLVHEW